MKTLLLPICLLLATATAFAAVQTKSDQDKPWRVYMLGDQQNLTHSTDYKANLPKTDGTFFKAELQSSEHYDHTWVSGWGGFGSRNGSYQDTLPDYSTGEPIVYAGSYTGSLVWDWTGWGVETDVYDGGSTYTNLISIKIGNEHCDVDDTDNPWAIQSEEWFLQGQYLASYWPEWESNQKDTYTRKADTVWHVQTGGKGVPRQNLWQFGGSASEVLSKRSVPPFYNASTRGIDPTQIQILGKNLDTNGVLYTILPDGQDLDVTPQVKGADFYTFGVGGQKYLSHFEVFVRQPFPRYPDDATSYGPDGPPLGWPVYDIAAGDAGHAWWRLSTDAPMDIVSRFTTTNCLRWMNAEAGYGPESASIDYWQLFLLQGIVKRGPGKVYGASLGPTVHRTYGAGFLGKGVNNGVNYVESLSQHPGEWDSEYHNCVHETVLTGKATGIPLPISGTTPERFGFNLPPDSD